MKRSPWFPLALAALLVACAHAGGGSPAPMGFTLATPEGWKQVASEDPIVFLTKDGGYKQFIMGQERPLDKPFQFTQKLIHKEMSPGQAAEVIFTEIAADQNIRNFSMLESVTAQIAGKNGFRLMFVYTDADNFSFKVIYYGFIHGNFLYSLRYGATNDEFFQKDLKSFQQVLASFKLTPAKAP